MIIDSIRELNKNSKCLLLFSGGFDSTLCAYWLKKHSIDFVGLHITYENRPKREIEIANEISELLKFELDHILLPLKDQRLNSEKFNFSNKAWFPYRNAIFFAIAANICYTRQCDTIVTGFRSWDTPYFTDSTRSYLENLMSVLSISGYSDFDRTLDLFLPFIDTHTLVSKIYNEDRECREVLDKSWSCWADDEMPCGECAPCKARSRFYRAMKTGEGVYEFE